MNQKQEKTKKKFFHRRVLITIGIIATFLSFAVTLTGLFDRMENLTIDLRYKIRGTVKPEVPVVIVAIDNETFPQMGIRWQSWPRRYYGTAIDNLKKWGAKIIAFDIIFSESSGADPKDDQLFATSIKKAGNVILGAEYNVQQKGGYTTSTLVLPNEILEKAAWGTGIIGHVYDADNVVRRTYTFVKDEDKLHATFSFEILAKYFGLRGTEPKIAGGKILWGKFIIPLEKNTMWINYSGPTGTFETIPFHKVFSGQEIDPAIFKNKIVIIGTTADITHDLLITPFSETGNMTPGVETYGNVLNTVITGRHITRMGIVSNLLLLLVIGILTSFLLFGLKARQGIFVFLGEAVVYSIVAFYLFKEKQFIIDYVSPVFTMLVCYFSISAYKVGVEEKETRKVRSVFSRYVSPGVVNELLNNEEIKLGGERKEVSILFSDIRGFTSMSEKMPPEDVVKTLNVYFSAMIDIVFKNSGTLDKFIGDAVMATFGTPVYQKDHAMRAVMTALMMKEKLNDLNADWAVEGKHPLKIGIGINSGEVVAGNMGSMKRMEYTVIGDAVNLASRLESLNKELGTEIIISESTYKMVKDYVNVKEYAGIKVKGKEENLKVYELLSLL